MNVINVHGEKVKRIIIIIIIIIIYLTANVQSPGDSGYYSCK